MSTIHDRSKEGGYVVPGGFSGTNCTAGRERGGADVAVMSHLLPHPPLAAALAHARTQAGSTSLMFSTTNPFCNHLSFHIIHVVTHTIYIQKYNV